MGVDLATLRPGRVTVAESPKRICREQSYGYLRAFWWVWLADGRSAVSAPPGAGEEVSEIAGDVSCAGKLLDSALIGELKPAVNAALGRAGLQEVDRVWQDVCFACDASLLTRHAHGDCRRLVDESVPPADGLRLPTHCFPDGIAYGVVADGRVVSVAYAHRSGVMADRVADLGVMTAAGSRRRGYAKTAVSAVVEHITRTGGEAVYGCRPDNHASIATARSVGFVPYAKSLILAAPPPDIHGTG